MKMAWFCWLLALLVVNLVLSVLNGWTALGVCAVVSLSLAVGIEGASLWL
jgi:hypothetical protein